MITNPKYTTIVRLENEGDWEYYLANHPDIEGCISDGDTVEEALANLEEATELILEHHREHGLPIPPPKPLFNESGYAQVDVSY